jgi:hypothetical protein
MSLRTLAQTDSVQVEQFCQIIAVPKLLSNKVSIDVDFGEEKNFWTETRIKTIEGKVRKFNTIIDAMNYMGRLGWSFINAYPVKSYNTEIFHFAFRKLVYRSQLQQTN